jgi:hypothetical protein
VIDHSLTMMRCERCRAALASADAPAMIRAGTPCGVCGGVMTLVGAGHAARDGGAPQLETAISSVGGGVLPGDH